MTLAQELEQLLPKGEKRRFGQLTLEHSDCGTFSASHMSDAAMMTDPLEELTSIESIRDMARFDEMGNYRPLKSAPTLQKGWQFSTNNTETFLQQLDAVYPAGVATWVSYARHESAPTPMRDTLNRQTGMYRIAASITDQMANQIMRDTCSMGCIRKIAWPIDNACAVSQLMAHPKEIPLVCTEACTFAMNDARKLAKMAFENKNAPE